MAKKKAESVKKTSVKKKSSKKPGKKKLKDISPAVTFANDSSFELPEFSIPELDDTFITEVRSAASKDDIIPSPEDTPSSESEIKLDELFASKGKSLDSEQFLKLKEPSKPKQSFFSKLFKKSSKKETSDSTSSSSSSSLESSLKKGFEEDAKEYLAHKDDSLAREKEYIETMKRRVDNDFKERLSHVKMHEQSLYEKEKDIIEKDRLLNLKEIELTKKDEAYNKILSLQEELENKQISLQYQKQQIAELQAELALKDKALREKEIALDEREAEIKKLETFRDEDYVLRKENTELEQELSKDEDEIEFLQKEIDRQRESFEKQLQELRLESLSKQNPENVAIEKLLTAGYIEISQGNFRAAKLVYNTIRKEYKKESDPYKTLHKQIVELYNEIIKRE